MTRSISTGHDRSSTGQGLLFRPDLNIRPDGTAAAGRWIVGDPLRGEFYTLSQVELQLLRACDGSRSIAEILADFREQYPDVELAVSQLLGFYSRAVRLGLLIRHGARLPARDDRPPDRWWLNPLSMRLPGCDPGPLLDWLTPRLSGLFSRQFALLAGLLCLLALVVVVGQSGRLARDLAEAWSWSTPESLWLVLVTIVAVKIVHELAHAVTCHYYGGRCRELGPLLLFFLPTLYCDVTDAWGFSSRSRRIAVSLAGVVAETCLAAIAALLWSVSSPGPLRILSLVVLVTCSISTWMVNLNPLLTYDGYYVLSDAVGIPNLSAQAAGWWRGRLMDWLLGLPPGATGISPPAPWLLPLYGLCSWAYRLFVMAAMAFSAYTLLNRQRLAPVGVLLAATLLLGWLAAPLAIVRQVTGDPRLRRLVVRRRLLLLLLSWLALGAGLIFIPLPRTLTAPGLLEPALTQPLFIPVGGTVEWALPAGTLVRAGDVVFGLRDLPTELRLEELRLRRETLQRRLLAAEARRADEPELSLALPSLEEALQGVQEQLALAQAEVDRLQVTATSSGWLLPPPRRPRAPGDRQPSEPLPFWTGSPLDPENRGCHLARGELGCLITTGLQQVSLLVHQSEVGLLSLGQLVQFRERSWVGAPLRGTVTEIGQAPLTELPREIAALGEIPLNSSASGPLPKEPHYLVRVSLAPPPDSTLPGMVGWASVAVEPATVATRLRDWIHKNLRLN